MKILKYFMSLAMAAGLMASCTKDLEEVQTYAPENVVAPSIHALDVNEVVITADNQTETLTFSWDAADYGAPTAINYAIMAAYNGTEAPVISGINELEYAVTYEALNAVVAFDLGCPLNVASDVAFRISASISSTYPTVYSESVTLKVTPTAAEKKYDMYYVIGSFNGWAHGTVAANYDFLYNFSGDGNTYEGIIDFREVGGAIEFKFTHGAAWGDGEMSAAEGQKELEEPSAVTLVAGGGDNIFAYGANRYYHFTLDVAGLTLTKNDAFDMIGVIGDFNSWGGDVEMTYNAQKRRFYADVENLSGGFKFRANGGWDKNWGITDGKLGNGGDNIAVETAGNYRVYLYLSESANIYYELSADMYGVEGDGNTEAPVEPTPPDQPVTPEKQDNLWEVIGNVNGTEWTDAACYMKEISEGVWFSPSFALAGEFKLRYNNDWNVNFGLTEGSDIALATPYVATAGGANIAFPEGNYQVALYEETSTIIVFALDGTGWGVVGSIASFGLAWNGDLMTYDEGGKLALKGVTLTTADEFKFREGQDWKNDRGFGAMPAKNVYVDAAAGGANMKVSEDGVYDLYLDLTNEKIYVMAAGVDPATATYVEPTEQPAPQPAALKLYAHSEEGWSNMNLWAWDDANNYSGGTWPGVALTEKETVNGVEYFVYSFGEDMRGKTISIIFNNGSAQTQDITGVVLDGPHYYGVKAGNGFEVDPSTYTGGDGSADEEAWFFFGSDTGWSSAAMTYDAAQDGWKYTINATAESHFVIHNNGQAKWIGAESSLANGTVGTDSVYFFETGVAFNATDNKVNIAFRTAGEYDVWYFPALSKACIVNAGATPAK